MGKAVTAFWLVAVVAAGVEQGADAALMVSLIVAVFVLMWAILLNSELWIKRWAAVVLVSAILTCLWFIIDGAVWGGVSALIAIWFACEAVRTLARA